MKNIVRIFTIIGMVFGALFIVPLIVGIITLEKLKTAKSAKELTTIAILNLLFCSLVGGICMLVLTDNDLKD